MKTTIPSLLKSLTSMIHPPLPLIPRDSQRILGLLKSSFRQHLNQDHEKSNPSKPNPFDAHVASVLASPFFKGQSKDKNGPLKEPRALTNFVGEVQGTIASPMDHFQEQVAADEATPGLAKLCLIIQRQNTTYYQDAVVTANSKDRSSVAYPVLHWLWASGLEESMEFLHNYGLVQELVRVMVIEKRDRHLWKWLHRLEAILLEPGKRPDDSTFTKYHRLLKQFIWNVVRARGSVDEAINIYLKAWAKFERSPGAISFKDPAATLLWCLMSNKSIAADSSLYDELLSAVKRSPFNSHRFVAQLRICHPTRSDPSSALHFIRDKLETLPRGTPTFKRIFRLLCLRTAEVLETKQEYDTAKELRRIVNEIPDSFQVRKSSSHTVAQGEDVHCEEQIDSLMSLAI